MPVELILKSTVFGFTPIVNNVISASTAVNSVAVETATRTTIGCARTAIRSVPTVESVAALEHWTLTTTGVATVAALRTQNSLLFPD
jgi:hypothetical protein